MRTRMDHVALYVNDLEKVRAFYERYFSAKPGKIYQNPQTGLKTCFLEFNEGCRVEIMTRENPDGMENELNHAGYIHVAVSVGSRRNVNELTERLECDGYGIVSGPRMTGDGYYESCVLDPENNQIEIVE